jgi:hypothetical protein
LRIVRDELLGVPARKLLLLAVSAALLGLSGQASANLVLNPNFDLNSPSPGVAPLDWTLTIAASGSLFFVGEDELFPPTPNISPPNTANYGAVGATDDTISQTLHTVAGDTYTISFYLAHDSTNTKNDFSASFGGVKILSLVNAAAFGWTFESFTEVATSNSTVLSFSGRENVAFYGLDNVDVEGTSGVPEPSTWAMMLIGFAGLGVFGYRARRRAAAA